MSKEPVPVKPTLSLPESGEEMGAHGLQAERAWTAPPIPLTTSMPFLLPQTRYFTYISYISLTVLRNSVLKQA